MKLTRILVVTALIALSAQAHATTRLEAAAICAGNYHVIGDEAIKRNRGDIYSSALDAERRIYMKYNEYPEFQAKWAAAVNNKSLDWPTRAKLAQECAANGF